MTERHIELFTQLALRAIDGTPPIATRADQETTP